MSERDYNADFEEFWKIFDPNEKLSPTMKELARKLFVIGAIDSERLKENDTVSKSVHPPK